MLRDSAAPCLSGRATGMALSVLTEIGRLLETLADYRRGRFHRLCAACR